MTSYLKIFLAVTLGFGVLHLGALLVFLNAPKVFYHRPWEYFDEIAYRVEGMPAQWAGTEYEDLTRSNFIYYQYGHPSRVTTDEDGFRSRPVEVDRFPVLVAGDSTVFGSGLSDDETLPWRLAGLTGLPVFNGGRTSLSNAVAHPRLGSIRMVIHALTERNIHPRKLETPGIIKSGDYQPVAINDLKIADLGEIVPPQRYSLPLIALNTAFRLANDFKTWRKGGEQPYLFWRHSMQPEKLDETVALIAAYSRSVESRGIDYVFVPVPAKQTLYAENVDDYTRNFIPVLVERLRAEGVHAIDLTTPFLAHKDEGLYFHYDTHWNEKGTALAARILAEQLFTE